VEECIKQTKAVVEGRVQGRVRMGVGLVGLLGLLAGFVVAVVDGVVGCLAAAGSASSAGVGKERELQTEVVEIEAMSGCLGI